VAGRILGSVPAGPVAPAVGSGLKRPLENARPRPRVGPRGQADGDAEALERRGRGVLFTQGPRLGADDRWSPRGSHLSHRVLPGVRDDDVRLAQVTPEILRRR